MYELVEASFFGPIVVFPLGVMFTGGKTHRCDLFRVGAALLVDVNSRILMSTHMELQTCRVRSGLSRVSLSMIPLFGVGLKGSQKQNRSSGVHLNTHFLSWSTLSFLERPF